MTDRLSKELVPDYLLSQAKHEAPHKDGTQKRLTAQGQRNTGPINSKTDFSFIRPFFTCCYCISLNTLMWSYGVLFIILKRTYNYKNITISCNVIYCIKSSNIPLYFSNSSTPPQTSFFLLQRLHVACPVTQRISTPRGSEESAVHTAPEKQAKTILVPLSYFVRSASMLNQNLLARQIDRLEGLAAKHRGLHLRS